MGYSVWFQSAQLSALIASASKSLGFQDLAGSSVGQTTGEGPSAQLTLDTTAAGHGWYIDATPLDNTDDYLPTSNPNIWQAKAGTDAAVIVGWAPFCAHAATGYRISVGTIKLCPPYKLAVDRLVAKGVALSALRWFRV